MLYDIATAILSLPVSLMLLATKRGRKNLPERFGLWNDIPRDAIWFHGASVGEIQSLIPIVKRVRALRQSPIVISATSNTGLDRAKPFADATFLLPYDSVFFLRHIIKRMHPRLFIFGETELWPALLRCLRRNGVPRIMVNARLAAKARKAYRFLHGILSKELSALTFVAASESRSLERLRELGVSKDKSEVTGNAKYDFTPANLSPEACIKLREDLGFTGQPVVVLGSLRPGEEAVWFEALARSSHLNFRCIIAPRHAEKFEYFDSALRRHSLSFSRKSAHDATKQHLLLDSMGELVTMYQIADLVFIGATLIPGLGGHNPLEAAIYGVPIVLGPYGDVIEEVREKLEEQNAYTQIATVEDAVNVLTLTCSHGSTLKEQGERAALVAKTFQGAVARIMVRLAEAGL